MGQAIRHQVLGWVGVPVCVGIGATKTLAKLANHIAKKQPQFAGVPEPTDELRVIVKAATWGLRRIYRPEFLYKKADIMLTDLVEGQARQGTLFGSGVSTMSLAPLMAAFDSINKRLGRDTVRRASAAGPHRWVARF
ncbi:DUF4113 domain-containing protein [Herbaspirillum sp. WGmk3]|uniref:DUF4113 domain-containing protein n=1 Tax=Herbaspirillum sp. WGmk3 TaxID=2919925 RepID=UPI00208FFEE3|nr:DUF4113 domain-containing protein [Herbaspirillum sp. WGmk3]MCO4856044.1 DUF4113 domain-containing protein [Herbaspirillum sp. WGmk3]